MANKTHESAAKPQARLADLDEIRTRILPNFLSRIPSAETCRAWFDAAGIARFKTNPGARRGGGRVFYSVAGVEKFLNNRTLAGRVTPRKTVSRQGTQRIEVQSHTE